MRVLFVNYYHLDSNAGIHIFNLANHLTRLGMECLVCVPDHKETVAALGRAFFEVIDVEDARRGAPSRNVDLIHAWTPREIVRKNTLQLLQRHACPYVVHLEDNEVMLTESYTGIPLRVLKRLPALFLNLLIDASLSHPRRYPGFLSRACGVTMVIETLREFCPANLPSQTIWAGYQEDLPWDMPADLALRHRLGIAENEFVVVYTGNLHSVNLPEVESLYRAVALLRERGIPVKLVRTGSDHLHPPPRSLVALRQGNCIELGHIARPSLPSVLSIADVLVQPGKPGRFNDYRFPSKLPEYLASGKAVLLPKTNIGHYLRDGEECLLLSEGDAPDIAQKLEALLSDAALRKKIGAGGRRFAANHLQWGQIAGKLHSFYDSLLTSALH